MRPERRKIRKGERYEGSQVEALTRCGRTLYKKKYRKKRKIIRSQGK